MKKSKDVLNLPVMAITEGDLIGKAHSLLINPNNGTIDYLLLEGEKWYLEKYTLAFSDVSAIGHNAVTTEKKANIQLVSQVENAVKLLESHVPVLGSRIMTSDGLLIGKVTEIFFDEHTGEIKGCELTAEGESEPAGIIPVAKIITYGQKYLIVNEDANIALTSDLQEQEDTTPVQPTPAKVQTATENQTADKDDETEDPLKIFGEKQREYLIGKKVSKTIIDSNGNIVAAEGTVITEEVIEQAMRVDKYVELTMFVK
ncbi:Uncharacterized protein YrrD, contains PRC-barrel domain [Desulfotomaculum arcticum]|uniref:Uncharacterized protein YrrD, contains PRC-barrel domain n=1 Tax=Desulfotruncus arcticus DSM 17038 TaxID=1121424 RepID=A0A1I2YGP5_9FIRM|nr:PRC-barrel domain-containing protein [Desulfotruncus arcticus]SFH24790.1 Uncharacterized protein YrrD, contains PRC-barrel domain [Desulfotomaculum arcticum] [Desulfotruncus arcticus DSM 17038]